MSDSSPPPRCGFETWFDPSPTSSSSRLVLCCFSTAAVPVCPSRDSSCHVAHGCTYQFKALCFGLSTTPQVFTQVMAPVLTILHSLGIRMRRYLDDWLVQSFSREGLLRDLEVVLSGVGDSCQPGEVQLHSVSGGPVSRGGHRRADFYGFSFARSRLQAVVNRRRISAFRRASCRLVAVAGDVVLPVAFGSGRTPAYAVTPDLPSPLLGSVGSIFLWRGLRTAFETYSGGFTGITSLAECVSVRYPWIWTFGPTLLTSAGGLT